MNDPNGLVFLNGEYHLFYQYNPTASGWGQIGWGHAVSRDLVHWQELPAALPATEDDMVFSGSAVVDSKNTSGLADRDLPAIVAIYTNHSSSGGDPLQAQHIAWSVDEGRSWHQYHGNPVLDIGSGSFRDPKVFWHEDSQHWIMAVALASQCKIQFYQSPNLLHWKYLSSFGPCGNTKGEWECPDLFPLRLEDEPDRIRWILKVDNTLGATGGGSGGQYFIGEFDGMRFSVDRAPANGGGRGVVGVNPLDYGSDFYAAMTWSNLPAAAGRQIWLAWMSNWLYADKTPTHPWRGVQSFPRSLHLISCGGNLRLAQRPAEELLKLRGLHKRWSDIELTDCKPLFLEDSQSEMVELAVQLAVGADARVTLRIARSSGSATTVSFDSEKSELIVDRRQTSSETFHPDFPACHRGPLRAVDGLVSIRFLLDHCCLEIFGGQGETVMSDLLFPDGIASGIEVVCEQGTAAVRQLDLWHLGL